MATYLINPSFLMFGDPELVGNPDARRAKFYHELFNWEPVEAAWHGGQSAVLIRTDRSVDEVAAMTRSVIGSNDLCLVVAVDDRVDPRLLGLVIDNEGLAEIFPNFVEVDA